MNKLSVFSVLSIATLLLSSIGIAFAPPSINHKASAVWIDNPPFNFFTNTTAVGYKFNVTVAANVTTSDPNYQFYDWQVYFDYPSSWLSVSNIGFTGPGGTTSEWFTGKSTVPIGPADTGTSVYAGESLKGNGSVTGVPTTLFWVEFQITKAPAKGQGFSDKFDLTTENGLGNIIFQLNDTGGTTVAVVTFDDAVTYTWSPPTAVPYMAIVGPSAWPLTYGPGVAVGQTFDAKIYLKNIDPNWALTNITFNLVWNNTVISLVGGLAAVTVDPAWTPYVDTLTLTTDQMDFHFAGTYGAAWTPGPPYDVLVATLHFTVMTQASSPPAPTSYVDQTPLTFSGMIFWDHTIQIQAGSPVNGQVNVGAYVALLLPWLQLDPINTIVGPGPSIGSIICVGVDVENLTGAWNTVGIQFRLQYDETQLQLLSVTEGPFLQNPVWDLHGTYVYTQDNVGGDPTYPVTHVVFADLLYPNLLTGIYDQTVFPNAPLTPHPETSGVNPTVAIFCFKVLNQNCFGGANITTALNILPMWPPHDENFVDKDGNYIDDQGTVNGTVTIMGMNFSGRVIDMYGGAVNDGYGILVGAPYLQFPAPYGGQGPNVPMDEVFPQSWLYLHANVTYNYWPVQNKDVGFEIEGPYIHLPNGSYVPAPTYRILAKFTATSDVNGVASYAFRMPWPCFDDLTGVWKITSTVTIADQVVSDTMMFYYQHQVYITGVTTDSYSYIHGQCVKVTVNYSTHSTETYPVLFAVVITDDLGVPFGMALYSTTVGGAVFCTWKNGTFSVYVCIPKWAYAGNASVHVSVYDKDPTIGGEAIGPEFTPDPVINIYPY